MSEKIPFVQVDTTGSPAIDAVADGETLLGTEEALLIAGKDGTNKAQFIKTAADGAVAITDNADSLTVDDGGGSLTVDGAVSVSNFPATQPVSAASLPLPTGAATSVNQATANGSLSSIDTKLTGIATNATLTGGTLKSIARGGAKGATAAADITSTAAGANHQALDVVIYDEAGNAITSFGGTGVQGAPNITANAWPIKVTDGTSTAAVKAASTAATAADPAQVVAISPNNSVAVTAASLPLPTGAATETTVGTRLADATFTGRINTLGQKTSANSTPVVLASDQSTLTVTANLGTVSGLALDTTLTGNNQRTRLTDGTNIAAVKPATTAPVAADPALVVAISPNSGGAFQDTTVSGTITVTGGAVTTGDLSGQGTGIVSISGTWTGNINFLMSLDGGTTWNTYTVRNAVVGGQTGAISTGVNGVWRFACGGYSHVRVASSGGWSGTASVVIRTSPSTSSIAFGDSLPVGSNVIGAVTQSGTWSIATPDSTGSGAIGSLGATQSVALAGKQGCSANIVAGTLAGTVVPEISLDGGTTWHASYFIDPITEARSTSLVFTNPNANTVRGIMVTPGTSHVRVRVSAYTSGTTGVVVRATNVPNNTSRLDVGPTGTATPPNATLVGGTDGTNLTPLPIKASGVSPAATDPSLVVTLSPNSADAEQGRINVTSATAYPLSILAHSYTGLRLQVTGVFTANIVVQGSNDNATWQTIQGFFSLQGVAPSISGPAIATYMIGGFSYLRLSCTSYTSGTMVVDYTLTKASMFSAGGAAGTPYPITSIADSVGTIMPSGANAASAIATSPAEMLRGSLSISSATNVTVFSPVNASGVASLTGSIGAGYTMMRLQTQGIYTATAVVQGTIDGTIWTSLIGINSANSSGVLNITGSGSFTANVLTYNVAGFASIRVSCTSYASGTILIDYSLSKAAMIGAANPSASPYGTVSIGDLYAVAAVKGTNTPATMQDPALVVVTAAPPIATLTNVSTSTSSVQLMASDAWRRGATICNDAAAVLYVKFGTTASSTSYTVALAPAVGGVPSYYEVHKDYTGRIDGILASGTGTARITVLVSNT